MGPSSPPSSTGCITLLGGLSPSLLLWISPHDLTSLGNKGWREGGRLRKKRGGWIRKGTAGRENRRRKNPPPVIKSAKCHVCLAFARTSPRIILKEEFVACFVLFFLSEICCKLLKPGEGRSKHTNLRLHLAAAWCKTCTTTTVLV